MDHSFKKAVLHSKPVPLVSTSVPSSSYQSRIVSPVGETIVEPSIAPRSKPLIPDSLVAVDVHRLSTLVRRERTQLKRLRQLLAVSSKSEALSSGLLEGKISDVLGRIVKLEVALNCGLLEKSIAQSMDVLVASSFPQAEGNFLLIFICNFHVLNHFLLIYICKLHWNCSCFFLGSSRGRRFRTASRAAIFSLGAEGEEPRASQRGMGTPR